MTDKTGKKSVGWVLYDGQCGLCRRTIRALMPALRRAGFEAAALQEPWVGERLGMSRTELLEEMRVIAPGGQLISGADAFVYLGRFIPWLWPLRLIARVPGGRPLLRSSYRWVAAHRSCGDACPIERKSSDQVKP
jgi:predicted DCC family thiol-disulfide oxidoreductase YuxK